MKTRRELLRNGLITIPLVSSPLLLASALAQAPAAGKHADPNQWFWFPGHTFCMKATGADTGGTSGWLMAEAAPRAGVPFHKHDREDESFLVVEGTFEITTGDTTVTGGPGTYAFGPRNIPHRWTNIGETRGRIMNVYTPPVLSRCSTKSASPFPTPPPGPPSTFAPSSPACPPSPLSTATPAPATSNSPHRPHRIPQPKRHSSS